jgi:hypothetical protein
MEKFFAGAFDRGVAVAIFVVLGFDVFFFGDKNNWDFLHPISVGDSVVFFEMGALMDIIEDRSDVG